MTGLMRLALFSDKVPFQLPDQDVFEIDAAATPPRQVRAFSGVGTTLFNMAIHPLSGALYVTNFEARNNVRFAGPGTHSTSVRGHVVEDRITVIKSGGVLPRSINKHLDYTLPSEWPSAPMARPFMLPPLARQR